MKTLKLTDKQFDTLIRILDNEWEQEWLYQVDGDKDTEWLKEYLDLYKVIYGRANNFMEAFVNKELIEIKERELKECE